MVISEAKILLGKESVIKLERYGEMVVDSEITGGKIKASDKAFFTGCLIRAVNKFEQLGSSPPHPMPVVSRSMITDTELPDSYYENCMIIGGTASKEV